MSSPPQESDTRKRTPDFLEKAKKFVASIGERIPPQKKSWPSYAYAPDIEMLRILERIPPLVAFATAIIRMNFEFIRASLLGSAVRVNARQFPSLHRLAEQCAQRLGMPLPELYVANSPFMNAHTFGTEEKSFIVLSSSLVDACSEEELRFVIGHEMGHIQSHHIIFHTIILIAEQLAFLLAGPIVLPAALALRTWHRYAEITCDRAGLICAQNLEAACRSFIRIAVGSHRLAAEVNIDELLSQIDASNSSFGRYIEALSTHPFLPKRIKAIQIFSESHLYRQFLGLDGGLPIEEVNRLTKEIIRFS